MPYFKWVAIDEHQVVHRGIDLARSDEHMRFLLQRKRMQAVISCVERKDSWPSIRAEERGLFFRELGSLIRSGIYLAEALRIIEAVVQNKELKKVVRDCSVAVHEGIPLSQACEFYVDFFTPTACRLLLSGEESATLDKVCLDLADYYDRIASLGKKIKTALFMPLITFILFLLILGLFFFIIIPQFAYLLESLHKPLPSRTTNLIALSAYVRANWLMLGIGCIGTGFLIVACWRSFIRKRLARASFLLYIPLVKTFIHNLVAASFFRILGILLQGGVDIARALAVADSAIVYIPLRSKYEACRHAVEGGSSLNEAFKNNSLSISATCQAFIDVGEATGTLGPMLLRCADYYQERLSRSLDLMSSLIQPLVLIVLGLCVALLIVVLYEPMLALSSLAF